MSTHEHGKPPIDRAYLDESPHPPVDDASYGPWLGLAIYAGVIFLVTCAANLLVAWGGWYRCP